MRIDTPVTANTATLERTLQAKLPVLLVLYHQNIPADLESAMKNLAKKTAENLLIVKVDAAENPELHARYKLSQGVPALIAIRDGEEVARTHQASIKSLENYADYLLGKISELKKETPSKSSTKPVVVTDSTFAEQVLKSDRPVLVDFWAAWCGPCRMIAPTLEKLAGEYAGRFTIAKLNVDENPQVSGMFGIRSIPTLLVFKNGKKVDQAIGALPEPALRNLIQKHL